MIPIKLSRDAANYVRNETEYLRRRNQAAARNFSTAIKNVKRMLQSFPEAGNRTHGLRVAGSLTFVTGDYLVDYIYDGSSINIIAVRHGRMLTPTPDVELDDNLANELDTAPQNSDPSP